MKKFFNDSQIVLEFDFVPDSVIIRKGQFKMIIENIETKEVTINTDGWETGIYLFQARDKNSKVIHNFQRFEIVQNLETAPDDFDFRSEAEKTLEAINSFLAGTASHQQKRIKVGDKEIEYSSFDELIKWKNFFEK